jgi:hypothetical protein
MCTEPCIDFQRQGEQGKHALRPRGERHQMPPSVSALMEDGQRHLLEGGHEALGRRRGRGPCGNAVDLRHSLMRASDVKGCIHEQLNQDMR